jgi:hypothetical protein
LFGWSVLDPKIAQADVSNFDPLSAPETGAKRQSIANQTLSLSPQAKLPFISAGVHPPDLPGAKSPVHGFSLTLPSRESELIPILQVATAIQHLQSEREKITSAPSEAICEKTKKAPADLLQGHSQDPEPTNNADQDGAGQPGMQSRNRRPYEVRCLSEFSRRAVV